MTILDELREEIYKECKNIFIGQFEPLIEDYEDRNHEARQRDFMDFIIDNMPGADIIEELPDLL